MIFVKLLSASDSFDSLFFLSEEPNLNFTGDSGKKNVPVLLMSASIFLSLVCWRCTYGHGSLLWRAEPRLMALQKLCAPWQKMTLRLLNIKTRFGSLTQQLVAVTSHLTHDHFSGFLT